MSVTVTQPEINTKERFADNKQRYGNHGKRVFEADTAEEVRDLLGDSTNIIINGDFRIWQRGTSQGLTAGRQYLTDRFWASSAGTNGQDKITGLVHENAFQVTAGSTNTMWVGQFIEDKNILTNKTVTMTVQVVIPYGTAGCYLRVYDGTVGAGTLELFKFVPTGKLQTVSHTFNLGDHVDVSNFWTADIQMSLSVGDTMEIHEYQLNFGSQIVEFQERHIAEEIKLCQRYYQKSYDLDTAPGAITDAGMHVEFVSRNQPFFSTGVRFATRMRAIPTIQLYSNVTGNSGVVENSGDKSTVAEKTGEAGITITHTATGISTASLSWHYTANAEI